ncbi:MAG TPA: RsmE family RNA methyltransferase, partial [Desulfobacteria bacterium]|nr:RsmE family RNA methyltransferase [Desulfobacteria bacterium]
MHRFQVAREDVGEKSLLVKGQQAIHLTRVLRLGIGAELFAFDNSGFEYRVRVSELRGDEVLCEIVTRVESKSEPPLDVFLIQGLPKSDKMELIIQKTTELGIKAIYPVRTTRAVVRLEGTKAGAKVERWQKIAVEAAKQCRRSLAPEVKQVM